MRFECPGCDTILTRDAALKHTKHGGICNTMYPIRHETKSANDHDIEDRVRKIEEESNQHNIEKKEDANEEQIKKQEEDKIKRLEAYRAETREEIKDLDDDEIEKIKESLKADLEELKKNQTEDRDEDKQSKSASREHVGYDNSNAKYSVLTYNVNSIESHEGDSLLMLMGSKNETTKGNSKDDDLLISLGSSE